MPVSERNRASQSEADSVRAWRVKRLVKLGFTRAAAKRLQDVSDVVASAEELLRQGCEHVTAYKLLLPIDTATASESNGAPAAESNTAQEHPLLRPPVRENL